MRAYITLVFGCLICCFINSQNITSAEYYFDNNDNGFGNNNIVTVNQQNENYSISTVGLNDGFHDVYFRVFDQAANSGIGAWSLYDRSTFYVKSFLTGQNIVAARYAIDGGSYTNLSVSPSAAVITETYSIPIGSLSEGFHSLYIETQDDDDTWSHYDKKVFYVSAFPIGQDIVAARYFFNTEVPINLSIDLSAPNISQSYTIATTGLSEGFHSFYIQTQVVDGTWSLYDRQTIYINDFDEMPSDIVSAEYFIDEDPGVGLGTSFDITTSTQIISFNTTGLSEGSHLFCIRVQNANGSWSLYDCEIFIIDPNLGIEDSLYKLVSVNPNPFLNSLNIDVSRSVIFESIAIYDMTGKRVYESNSNLRSLDLANLESGTYILSLQTESEKATFKIIKQ